MNAAAILALLQPREYYEVKPHKAPDDIERVREALNALSTPPADDVREALVKELRLWSALIGSEPRGARELFIRAADALSEVRPNQTSTPPADDVREALYSMLRWGVEDDEMGLVDRILDRFEVRPRGTVTDTEVEVAWRTYEGIKPDEQLVGPGIGVARSKMRAALEAAREVRS